MRSIQGAVGPHGYPRVDAELKAIGVRCSRKRVARLMRKEGLGGGACGAAGEATTPRDPAAIAAADLGEELLCRGTKETDGGHYLSSHR